MAKSSQQSDVVLNQLVWAAVVVNDEKRNHWPAIVLNPKEWKNVDKRWKPILDDEKLIWQLNMKPSSSIIKVNDVNLIDFVASFAEVFKFSRNNKNMPYRKAITDACQIACLSQRADVVVNQKNLISVMFSMAKSNTKIVVSSKSQWKIAIPKQLHETLVEPYFKSDDECDDVVETTTGSLEQEIEEAMEVGENDIAEEIVPQTSQSQFKQLHHVVAPLVKENAVLASPVEVMDLDKLRIDDSGHKQSRALPLTANRKSLHSFKTKNFACFACPTKSPNMEEMLAHVLMHTKNLDEDSAAITYLCCPHCHFYSPDETAVKNHVRVHFDHS